MTPEQRSVVGAITGGPRGGSSVSGPFDALLASPPLADAVQKLGSYLRFETALPPALTELAILLTAYRWRAQFEWYAHRRLALRAGLDPSIVSSIATGERPLLDQDELAVYEFASELLANGHVTDHAWQAVFNRWGHRGAIELIGIVGYYCLISFVLNVDRYPSPDGDAFGEC